MRNCRQATQASHAANKQRRKQQLHQRLLSTVIISRESNSDAHPVHEPESDSGEDCASLTELHNDEPPQHTAGRTAGAHGQKAQVLMKQAPSI